mgnify:FL=1
MRKKHYFIAILLFIVSLLLFFPALTSSRPLGLDALGHLSKISYINEQGLPKWDASWYAGTPFLESYSPLFYYLASLFNNSIFGAIFLVFLSIFLTSLGIYFLVFYYTQNSKSSAISSLSFLTVLSISYYYLSVGNYPYVFALWTIPFSLLALELSFKNKKYYPLFCLLIFMSIISHIFVGLCTIFIAFLKLLFLYKFQINKLWKIFLFLIPGIMASGFWLIPFLTYTNYFSGSDIFGIFIPSPYNIFGLSTKLRWGLGGASIGVLMVLFVFTLFIFIKNFRKEKTLSFLFLSSIVFLFFMFGGLGKLYPSGIGPERFILPFSVLASLFVGSVFNKMNNKKIIALCFLIITLGLMWNFNLIRSNINEYSHESWNGELGYFSYYNETGKFPFDRDFDNYRYGGIRYSAKALNFFFPGQSQISGYYDQQMLFPEQIYSMMDKVWNSDDLNSTLLYFDEYSIKYFEIRSDNPYKQKFFDNPPFFKENVTLEFGEYNLTIFEYTNAKPILSYVNDKETLTFEWERSSPDEAFVYFDYSEKSKVLFKESYHSSWKAKEIPSNEDLKISKNKYGMMSVLPTSNARGVSFYQVYTISDYLGFIVTLIGLLFLFLIIFYNRILDRLLLSDN